MSNRNEGKQNDAWSTLFEGRTTPPRRNGTQLRQLDGSTATLVPSLPLGLEPANLGMEGETTVWPIDPLPGDRWHVALPEDLERWTAEQRRIRPAWLETPRGPRRALLVDMESDEIERPEARRFPLYVVSKDGLVQQHYTEGGLEPLGYFVDLQRSPQRHTTRLSPEPADVERAVGCGLTLDFRDVEGVRIEEVDVKRSERDGIAFEITLVGLCKAIPELQDPADHWPDDGRKNDVTFIWHTNDGPPREWLMRAAHSADFLPGSRGYCF